MIRKLLFTGAVLIAAVTFPKSVPAADIVTKAPPAVLVGYPYQGSGLYGGIGVVGEVLSADITSNVGGSSVFSAGAALDLTAGYQWSAGSNWFAAEGSVQYTNIGGSVMCAAGVPCSVSSKWGFEQRGLLGFPIQTVLAVLPNLNNVFPGLPTLPGGVNADSTTSHPYLFVGLREDDVSTAFGLANTRAWKVQPVVGMGLRQQWKQGLVVDTSAGCTFANTGATIGGPNGAQANYGRDCRAALRFLY